VFASDYVEYIKSILFLCHPELVSGSVTINLEMLKLVQNDSYENLIRPFVYIIHLQLMYYMGNDAPYLGFLYLI